MSSAQFNAGQARDNVQGKTEEWVESAQNTANRASDTLSDSKDSAQQGKEQSAGLLQQGKTEEWVESAQNTANRASDTLSESKDSAQQGKEQSAGFLQQTGEQVMHMAQGAIDGVKNTLGVGGPHGPQDSQGPLGSQSTHEKK